MPAVGRLKLGHQTRHGDISPSILQLREARLPQNYEQSAQTEKQTFLMDFGHYLKL